jgi:phosphoribosylaminoimidazole-succinocarboxamide synthase
MEKSELLYEGKGKKLFKVAGDDTKLISEFKDDLTAFNAQKKSSESGKGALNNEISTIIFKELQKNGVDSHFIENISETEMLVKKVSIIPIEVVIRNVATGSLSRRLGIEDGKVLPSVLVEFYYKNDYLNDPIITDDHAVLMELVEKREELEVLKERGRRVNEILLPFFKERNLRLIDFKLEFGKDSDGNIILADEISPDSCRFWDVNSGEKLDKDRFRQDIGGVKVAYEEVRNRILGEKE